MTPTNKAELARLADLEIEGGVGFIMQTSSEKLAHGYKSLLQENADLEKEIERLKRDARQKTSDDFDREEFS